MLLIFVLVLPSNIPDGSHIGSRLKNVGQHNLVFVFLGLVFAFVHLVTVHNSGSS